MNHLLIKLRSFVFASFGLFTAGIIISMLFQGCSGSGNDDNTVAVTPSDIKANYVAMASAIYQDSLTEASNLQTAITNLIDAPTQDNLMSAKTAYKALRVPYQQSEIMRWDTDITLDTNTGDSGISSVDDWEGQVNAWPLAEGLIDYTDTDNTNNIIAGTDTITAEFLMAQNGINDDEANVATGIHAIEFLLWGQDLNGVNAGAGNRPVTDFDIGDNCTNGNCGRRTEYLTVVTQLLVDDLTDMVAEWSTFASTTPGTLAYNFLNSDNALAYIMGSMKVLADDELASARMGTALESADPEEEHDCFSDLSHVAIYYNFQGIRNAFYGNYDSINNSSVSGAGIGNLIKQTDESLYNKIDVLLTSIQDRMAQILERGEQIEPIRFDQIIGLGEGNAEFDNANNASLELIVLGLELNLAREALSLTELNVDGGGDGD